MLERKLEAIKDLKRQYYIGTGEAKEYLDAVADMPESRQRVARHLNRLLGTLAATEEAVLSICGMLDIMDSEAQEYAWREGIAYSRLNFAKWSSTFQEPDHDPTDPEQNISKIPDAWTDMIGQGYVLDEDYERFRVLIPLLQGSAGADEPTLYSNLIQQTANRIYQAAVLDGELEIDAKIKAEGFLRYLDVENVVGKITEQTIGDLEMGVRESLAQQHISQESIAERLARDQLLHRHEYRRQIATLYADRSGAETADEVIQQARGNLERSIRREEKAPEELKHLYSKERKTSEEVARVLASERNFLSRYLE